MQLQNEFLVYSCNFVHHYSKHITSPNLSAVKKSHYAIHMVGQKVSYSCTVAVSLNVCKEYLKDATFQTPLLNNLTYGMSFYVILYTSSKHVFGPPCIELLPDRN